MIGYCPLHGKELKNEKLVDKDKGLGIEQSKAYCYAKKTKHTVYIEDRQNYEQEGKILIVFS